MYLLLLFILTWFLLNWMPALIQAWVRKAMGYEWNLSLLCQPQPSSQYHCRWRRHSPTIYLSLHDLLGSFDEEAYQQVLTKYYHMSYWDSYTHLSCLTLTFPFVRPYSLVTFRIKVSSLGFSHYFVVYLEFSFRFVFAWSWSSVTFRAFPCCFWRPSTSTRWYWYEWRIFHAATSSMPT